MSDKAFNTVAVMLAGGQGSRLHELTRNTCKPAVPMYGGRRIVDWTMDNLARSSASRVIVATQFRPGALVNHLETRWRGGFAPDALSIRDGRVVAGPMGYTGTADAVTRNLDEIAALAPDTVLVVAADHVYRMDYDRMIAAHQAAGRPVTVAADRVSLDQARAFGVMAADGTGRVTDFSEKPRNPRPMPGDPSRAFVSMGIYVFDWPWLEATLRRDGRNCLSSHDFGKDILPEAVERGEVQVFDSADATEGAFYWRDVGTLDALRLTCIEMAQVGETGREICPCPPYPTGARATVGSARTQVLPGGTVVLPGARVAPGARLRNAIVAPGAFVPAGLTAGFDSGEDACRFRVTPAGTVLITAEMVSRVAVERARRRGSLSPVRASQASGAINR